jgi:serine protease Do
VQNAPATLKRQDFAVGIRARDSSLVRRKIMSPVWQVRRSAVLLSLAGVFVLGGLLGLFIPALAGYSISSAPRLVPMFVARGDSRGDGGASAEGFAAVVKPVLPAVVNISSSKIVRTQNVPLAPFFNDPFFRQFFGQQFGHQFQVPREQREESLGSGVIISPDGYILTNNHVVAGAGEIKVFLSDKREFKGKVIGADPKTDVAVVKIDATNLSTITLGDSSKLRVGDYALAIGDPFGIGETVTMGIVSATGRGGLDIEDYEDFIQTDAAINPGNSGGALINARGELIGINTAILSAGSGGNQGIGFAIPINMARYVLDQILKHGKVNRGYLGVVIQDMTPALAKAFDVPQVSGVLVSDVAKNGPGQQAGLERGDVILSVDGQPVSSVNDLRLRIAQTMPGTTVHLKILRGGHEREVAVKLGELPEKASQAAAQPGTGSLMQGVQVETLTADIAQQLGISPATKGVVVSDVDPSSAAAAAGLQRGDVIEQVNRQPVSSVREYDRAVNQAGKQPIVLLVNRGGTTSFIVVGG